jgi:hypothetical protein
MQDVSGDKNTLTEMAAPPIAGEFLYQLTKMLTDDNVEIIEW